MWDGDLSAFGAEVLAPAFADGVISGPEKATMEDMLKGARGPMLTMCSERATLDLEFLPDE
jgi:hypothetical protein